MRINPGMKRMLAEIRWIPKSQGGRSIPLILSEGTFYSPHIQFPDNVSRSPDDPIWSVVIEISAGEPEKMPRTVMISYRVSGAPENELQVGREFGLYEGPKQVAVGKILAPAK